MLYVTKRQKIPYLFLKIDLDPDEVFCENYDEIDSLAINIDEYEYRFENIVLEGGGNKGLAYAGAVRVRFMQYNYFAFLSLICKFTT